MVVEEEVELKNWEEADKVETKYSMYFKPEIGKEYTLLFEEGYKLIQKKFEGDDNPIVLLRLKVKNINGEEVNQEWSIASKKLKLLFRDYIQEGLLSKKKFKFKKTGEGYKTTYKLLALDMEN